MADQDDPDTGIGNAPQAAEASAQKENTARGQNAVAGSSIVEFNDSITIFPNRPLPEYDRGPVKAYRAQGSGRISEQIYALVCDPLYTPRSSKAPSYVTLSNPYLQRLVATSPIYWPLTDDERYIYIYQYTNASPLVPKSQRNVALGWKPEIVTNAIIRPLVSALTDLRNKDIVHGAIHPGNIYVTGNAKSIEHIMLGDCLSLPAGFDMHAQSETIARGMASPVARGVGTATDEMYSFGVTLALILRTYDPLAEMTEEEIVRHKIEHGSFSALISKDRLTGSILELLRGLLFDNEAQRWDLDDISAWLEGERRKPKSAGKKIKASRPLEIGGKKLALPELIAREGCNNPKALADVIENDEMQQWLERAIDSKELKERYAQAYKLTQDEGHDAGYAERLATRISIAFHPQAPIRFRELRTFPDGVGKALSSAIQKNEPLQTYTEFIQAFFVMQWLDMHGASGIDINSILNKFATCRKFLSQKMLGFGLERCVYHLNEETHCLSEKLRGFYIRNAEDMIRAFEKISQKPNRPAYFFDRHSVAFLAAKDRQVVDRFTHDLQSRDKYLLVLGELHVLESIQRLFRMEKFPGVASWIADNMDPVYEHIHDREKRIELKQQIEKEKKVGNLTKILNLFNNEKLFQYDLANFRAAMKQYHMLGKESEFLKESIEKDKNFGKGTGRVAAAVTSSIIAAIFILLTVIIDL